MAWFPCYSIASHAERLVLHVRRGEEHPAHTIACPTLITIYLHMLNILEYILKYVMAGIIKYS